MKKIIITGIAYILILIIFIFGMWKIFTNLPQLENIHETAATTTSTTISKEEPEANPKDVQEKIMLENKIDKNGEGHCYTCMGCRSFLTPYVDENGNPKYYGRFNQGVVTVNLVDIGLSANRDMNKFWKIFYWNPGLMKIIHLNLRGKKVFVTCSHALFNVTDSIGIDIHKDIFLQKLFHLGGSQFVGNIISVDGFFGGCIYNSGSIGSNRIGNS